MVMKDKPVLDAGYSWVILAAAFVYNVIETGVYMSSSVYMVEWLYKYDTTKAEVGLAGSIMAGVSCFMGCFTGPLVDKFGCRFVSYLGTSLVTIGFITSAFVPSIHWIYLTYGCILGIGEGLMLVSANLMVQYYFDKKRPFAAGIANIGHSLGSFITLPLTRLLIDQHGASGAMILHAGIVMQNIVLASFFRPIDLKSIDKILQTKSENGDRKENMENTLAENTNVDNNNKTNNKRLSTSYIYKLKNAWDFDLFRNRAFVQYILALSFAEYGIDVMYRFIPVKAVADDVTMMHAAWLPSITGICSTASRFVNSFTANMPCVNRTIMCGVAILSLGVVTVTSCAAFNFLSYAIFMSIFGIFMGMYGTVGTTVLTDLIGVSRLAQGCSFFTVLTGLVVSTSLPIAGWIIDTSGNYDISYYTFGTVSCICGLSILLMPIIYQDKYRKGTDLIEMHRDKGDSEAEQSTNEEKEHIKADLGRKTATKASIESLKSLDSS